jgi:hypothetical protein
VEDINGLPVAMLERTRMVGWMWKVVMGTKRGERSQDREMGWTAQTSETVREWSIPESSFTPPPSAVWMSEPVNSSFSVTCNEMSLMTR